MIDVSAWPGLVLNEQITEGNRNEVWRAELDGRSVAVRRSRRAAASLAWELDLMRFLSTRDFLVPEVVHAADGARSHEGVVVQEWIDGRPPEGDADWTRIAAEIQRLHAATIGYAQRPGCCTVLELHEQRISGDADLDAMPRAAADLVSAVFARFKAVPTAVVHGDVWAPNLRITPTGQVGLLDWDESRVDLTWHDLSPLHVPVLAPDDHHAAQQLSHAWEAANGWTAEPDYARRRLAEVNL